MCLLHRVNCNFSARAPRTTPKKWPNYHRIFIKTSKIFIFIPCFRSKRLLFGFYIYLKFPGLLPPFFLLFQPPLFHQIRPVSQTHSIPSSLLLARLSRPSVTSPYFPSVSSLLSTIPPPLLDPLLPQQEGVQYVSPPLFPVLIFQSEDEIRDDCFSLAHCSKIIDHGWTFLHQK